MSAGELRPCAPAWQGSPINPYTADHFGYVTTVEDAACRQGWDQPLDTLASLELIRDQVDLFERITVREARANGSSWAEIGAALGVTRQAAQQRFGR